MQVHLTPEQETRLVELAAREGRSPDQLLQEALDRFFEADSDFVEAVMKGLASLDRGEGMTHDEVGARIDRLFRT
jgi:predicted transcriptional regulator